MHFVLGGLGIILHTNLEVCQDRNPTVTVARQEFRKCCICPHAFDYGILVCSFCMICMITATSSWVCSQAFCNQRCENSPSLRKTPDGIHGMFLYYDVTSRKYFLWVSWCWLVSSTELVSRKSSFVVTIVYDVSWRAPTGEPIANPIKWKTY